MDIDSLTDQGLRDLIARAEALLVARVAVEEGRVAAVEAVEAYAVAAGLSVAEAWRALSPADVEAPAPGPVVAPEWMQPSGAHDAYGIGDLARFKGVVYESIIAGNTWSPAAYPQGWKVVQ